MAADGGGVVDDCAQETEVAALELAGPALDTCEIEQAGLSGFYVVVVRSIEL